MARTLLIAICDHPDTREGQPSMVRVGAARSFMIATSDQLDIYRAPERRSAGRCRRPLPRARPSVETVSAGRRAATAPHVTSAARGTVDALALTSASLRTAARRCRPWERCPTGRGQRRDLGLLRKPFLFFNKLYKASADFSATSCKEVEILTAWLKGQVARARWRRSSRGSQRGSVPSRSAAFAREGPRGSAVLSAPHDLDIKVIAGSDQKGDL